MLSEQKPVKRSDPDFDLVEDIYAKREQSETHLAEWRDDAKGWYAMVSGEQWDEDDEKLLDDNGKPHVSFNRVAVMVNALCGSEANNRQEVQFIPRQVDPQKRGVNDLLTDAAKWAREQCDAEDEESDAFRDSIICGYGWTETKMDYESNLDGMVQVGRRDPGCFHYDPRAIKRNLTGAKWIQCDDYLDEETILARWPDADVSAINTAPPEPGGASPHDATRAPFYLSSATKDAPDDSRLVIHHCWTESVAVWRVAVPGMPGQPGKLETMSDADYKVAQERSTQLGMPLNGRRTTKMAYKHAYILGKQVLEQGDAPCQYEFVYKCITGYRDRNRGTFYGLVKTICDPQRYANKMLSQLLHMINTNAKGGVMVEEGAVSDARAFEENWAKTDGVIWVNGGALSGQKIQPKPAPLYPQSIPDLLTFSVSSIRDGSGVPLEMLGLADRTQPGIVEEARTASGLGNVATLFDSLRQYRKQQGRLLAHFIIEYMSDGRLIRISGPLGQRFARLLRQGDVMDYDVIVDDAPTSRDMRAKTFEALMKIVPLVAEQGGPVPEEALDYAPIPSQLADSWKAQIAAAKQNKQPDPQVQIAQAVAQGEQAKVQVAQARGQADVQMAQLALQAKQADLELRRQESAWKAQEHMQAMELANVKLQELHADRGNNSDNQTKLAIAQINGALDRFKVELQEETKRMIAATQVNLQLSTNIPDQQGAMQ